MNPKKGFAICDEHSKVVVIYVLPYKKVELM